MAASLTSSVIDSWKLRFRGDVIQPGDSAYNDARSVWNGMIDRRPALIIRCVGTHDVILAIQLAREFGAPVAVKAGGHNVAGNAVCDGGVVIDLTPMRWVHVDASKKTARVGAGCLLGDVDHETQRYGLAISSGVVSHTGVAGLTLGGGFGWISRKHGLSVDNLISADMVLADGSAVTVSAKENPDLFWAIRGGGGNFGVVTSFLFKCAKVGPQVFTGLVVYPIDAARDYLKFHNEYLKELPDETTVYAVVRHAPPLPFLPQNVHGRLCVVVPFVHLGSQASAKKLLKPIREFGTPYGENARMTPWVEWQSALDGLNAPGARNYWKSHYLDNIDGAGIDAILEHAQRFPTPSCEVLLAHMGGAPSRVAPAATAHAVRSPRFIMNVHTRWADAGDDTKCLNWARDIWEATRPGAHGVYVNFISNEGDERVRDAYPPAIWDRLVTIKTKYDPENFFRMNQNIPPR
ncbi:MAG TPA: FAD-binding oxidoreductase [Candidatus Krumholzibacteria bacterium]|nr:FAD-binding oxidoreductase [Candidatus Krumholzibacteria bacterium]